MAKATGAGCGAQRRHTVACGAVCVALCACGEPDIVGVWRPLPREATTDYRFISQTFCADGRWLRVFPRGIDTGEPVECEPMPCDGADGTEDGWSEDGTVFLNCFRDPCTGTWVVEDDILTISLECGPYKSATTSHDRTTICPAPC